MSYLFIDTDTHKSLGKLTLSVELKKGHHFNGFGHAYVVTSVAKNDPRSAIVYLKQA